MSHPPLMLVRKMKNAKCIRSKNKHYNKNQNI
jgi:hypothetical protein